MAGGDIHGPDYRPGNVRVERIPEAERQYPRKQYRVIDFDGGIYRLAEDREEADRFANRRRGVIRAALTRRANKGGKA